MKKLRGAELHEARREVKGCSEEQLRRGWIRKNKGFHASRPAYDSHVRQLGLSRL